MNLLKRKWDDSVAGHSQLHSDGWNIDAYN